MMSYEERNLVKSALPSSIRLGSGAGEDRRVALHCLWGRWRVPVGIKEVRRNVSNGERVGEDETVIRKSKRGLLDVLAAINPKECH